MLGSAIALRLHTLSPTSPQQTTPFAVGALYALRRPKEIGYADKADAGRGMRMWGEAQKVCQLVANAGNLVSWLLFQ